MVAIPHQRPVSTICGILPLADLTLLNTRMIILSKKYCLNWWFFHIQVYCLCSVPPFFEITSCISTKSNPCFATSAIFSITLIQELTDLYSSSYINRVIKSRRMRWAWHVARMEEGRDTHVIGCSGRPTTDTITIKGYRCHYFGQHHDTHSHTHIYDIFYLTTL